MFQRTEVNQYINKLIEREGGYTNHPSDPGKATCWGWTEKNARKRGYTGDMRNFPKSLAKQWYYEDYWLKPGFDKVYTVNHTIANELFDSGVNAGFNTASKWLQLALNAFNRQERDYSDIVVDGAIGHRTIRALEAFLRHRNKNGYIVMMRALNALQGAYYINISQNNKKLEDFTFGWILNRVEM